MGELKGGGDGIGLIGYRGLTSLPIQGALIPEDGYKFGHLILFSGVCMVVGAGFVCVARMLRSKGGWKI